MKTLLSFSMFFILFISSSYGFNTYSGIKDTTNMRFYEAPNDESPYGYFKIIDISGLSVYSQKKHHPRYGSYLKYYYSLTPKSRIHELTLENLKVDFPDNHKFIKAVKNNEESLEKWTDGITLVNKLLNESLK
jgi:hypothetical protein